MEQASGFIQAQRFLVVERRHAGKCFEMYVEGRGTQMCTVGQFTDVQWFVEMLSDPVNGRCHVAHAGIGIADVGEMMADGAVQQTNQQFFHDERPYVGVTRRSALKRDEAPCRINDVVGGGVYHNPVCGCL